MELSRRDALRALATGATAVAGVTVLGAGVARAADLGTLIDYSAGVPTASAVRAGGYKGVIRYCSDARADWMAGKPVRKPEADAMREAGLEVVSCYQYGKGDTSDWLGGYDAGVHHATRGLELHRAAGGPDGAPIYMSIDSNPGRGQFDDQVLPFLQGCEQVLGHALTGVYCNAPTIDWAVAAGVGAYFWQHDWGSNGRVHDAGHLHQRAIDSDKVDGIGIDLNTIRKSRYGQWSAAGTATAPDPPAKLATQGPGGTGDGPLADAPEMISQFTDTAGDPNALLGNSDVINRVAGMVDRAAGLATRVAGRIG